MSSPFSDRRSGRATPSWHNDPRMAHNETNRRVIHLSKAKGCIDQASQVCAPANARRFGAAPSLLNRAKHRYPFDTVVQRGIAFRRQRDVVIQRLLDIAFPHGTRQFV
jgi:hypothetical protein